MEQVNHPTHYNQHPAGIECIEVIRHYTCDIANALKYLWRAGLKPEMGKEDAEKEIEDLQKALWYIKDYAEWCNRSTLLVCPVVKLYDYIKAVTGYSAGQIIEGYEKNVAAAINELLRVGLVVNDGVWHRRSWHLSLDIATRCIEQRILEINDKLINNEVQAINTILHGGMVEGDDFISKPGCVRETEPEHYDPLNMIVAWGRVYSLTDEIRKKPNGALRSPCENCDLMEVCYDDWHHIETSVCHHLCGHLHQAESNQYYREVGNVKYSPKFGTIEVIDEMKESEIEMRKLQEEEK